MQVVIALGRSALNAQPNGNCESCLSNVADGGAARKCRSIDRYDETTHIAHVDVVDYSVVFVNENKNDWLSQKTVIFVLVHTNNTLTLILLSCTKTRTRSD